VTNLCRYPRCSWSTTRSVFGFRRAFLFSWSGAHDILGGCIRHIVVDRETVHSISGVVVIALVAGAPVQNGSLGAQVKLAAPLTLETR
jgi:hypothetical protein